jgi:DNA end-binding protein Ku
VPPLHASLRKRRAQYGPLTFETASYEEALKELLRKKQAGQKIEAPKAPTEAKVINLMDALRRSVQAERGGGETRKSAQRSAPRRAPKKAARSSARKRAS